MANTSKKSTKTIENTEMVSESKSSKEIELENKLLQMEAMLQKLMSQQNQTTVETPIQTKNKYEDDDIDDIPFRKFIKVMSLTDHTLTLSTEGVGKGKLYNFVEFGQVIPIIYEDLSNIIHHQPEFTKKGVYMIMDKNIVKLHGLEADYEKILNKDTILNILNLDKKEIANVFKGTTPTIQETIVSILIDKLMNDENVDLNKLQVISDLCGKDINSTVREMKKSRAD